MKNIFRQEQSDETDADENKNTIFNETVEDNLEELQNQSDTTTSNVTIEKHNNISVKGEKKVSYKRMKTFQIGQNTNQTLVPTYLRRKKRVGMKEKRTAVNNGQTNETLYDEHMGQNNSSQSDGVNGTFTPRGFSPRGHNPRSLKPRGYNPYERRSEIVIGVSKGMEGDYAEYDHDASFFPDEGKTKPQYLIYEEPYQIKTEEDVNRYTNPDKIVENFLRTSKGTKRNYYIAAEEVQWDYAGGSRRYISIFILIYNCLL